MDKTRQRTVTLPIKIHQLAQELAKKEKRSVANYVTKLILEAKEK